MLLTSQDQIDHYHANGLWRDERLDQIYARHAKERADDVALVDDMGFADVTGRSPQCLTFARAHKRVVGLSAFLSGIGMKPDTVVAVLLPPCVDAAIVTLAASRLGLILAPLPLTSGEVEIREKIEAVGAKAVICCARYEDEAVADRVRNVAAEMFSIRFVFQIGEGGPEGLIELDPMMDDEASVADEDLDVIPETPSADAVLGIHWTAATSKPSRPVGRSHNQFLSAARHVCEQSEMAAGESLLVAHHLSGLTGFAAGLAAGLDIGVRLQFHHFKSVRHLVDNVAEFGIEHIMLPQGEWHAVHDCLPTQVREQLKSVLLAWVRVHPIATGFRENETGARLLDLTNFNELALFCQIRREPGMAGGVPVGAIRARNVEGQAWLETYLFGLEEARARFDQAVLGGELCVKGAMVPDHVFPLSGAREGEPLPANGNGFIHTEIGCKLVDQSDDAMTFRPLGELGDIFAFGGLSERAADLDGLFADCDGVVDAAAFMGPDPKTERPVLYAALVVEDKDDGMERFFASLQQKGVSNQKWPRDVILVDAIPRATTGTIRRDSLLEVVKVAQVA